MEVVTTPLAPPAPQRSLLDLSAGPWVLLGAAMTALTLTLAVKGRIYGFDFHGGAWAAGKDVLAGRSPYPAPDPAKLLAAGNSYIPPPLLAVLCVPLSLLPFAPAVVTFGAVCTAAFVLALRLVGVRDLRVYGLALTSFPFVASIGMGQPDGLLALGVALAWRYRSSWRGAVAVAAAVATLVVTLGTDRDLALFAATISFGLLASPIMWTHYLVALYVPLAVAYRRPEVWLLTIPYWLSPLEPPPHVWKVFFVLALTATVSFAAARPALRRRRARRPARAGTRTAWLPFGS